MRPLLADNPIPFTMNDFSLPLPAERTLYFSSDGLAIVLLPLHAGQPAKLLRHADGLLRAYIFTDEDADLVRRILREDGTFLVLGFKLLVRAVDQTTTAFAIPPHAAGLSAPCVLGGNENKILRRLPDSAKPDDGAA